MKIVSIIGTGHRGNTLEALQKLILEIEKHTAVTHEILWITDLALPDCIGCHACIMHGEHFCPHSVTVQQVVEKMQAADGIILASPVYADNVSGLMKKLFDHLAYLWHRPVLHHQWIAGVSTGGGMFGAVAKEMKKNAEAWGANWVGLLGVPHYDSLQEKHQRKVDVKTRQFGLTLSMDPGRKKVTVGRLIWFKMWKMNAAAAKETLAADYAYYKDKNYYDERQLPWVADKVSDLAIGMMRLVMSGVYKGY